MSTLQEIEAAVEILPREQQEILHSHLTARLQKKPGDSVPKETNRRLAAFESLQKSLGLGQKDANAWQETVAATWR